MVVVIVLVGGLAELFPPQRDPYGDVTIERKRHKGCRGKPPVVEVHVEHDYLWHYIDSGKRTGYERAWYARKVRGTPGIN